MGRAGRPGNVSNASGELRSTSMSPHAMHRRELLEKEGVKNFEPGSPAQTVVEEGGILGLDYKITVLEADDSFHHWQVTGPAGFKDTGVSESESRAHDAASDSAIRRAAAYKQRVLQRQKVYEARSEMLRGLRMPDRVGNMDSDVITDERLEGLQREDLEDGYSLLTFTIDRKHNRSPYPVIAEGLPQKRYGYLLFHEGEPLQLGDNNPDRAVKQPEGMWRGSRWRKKMRMQAEEDIASRGKRRIEEQKQAFQSDPEYDEAARREAELS